MMSTAMIRLSESFLIVVASMFWSLKNIATPFFGVVAFLAELKITVRGTHSVVYCACATVDLFHEYYMCREFSELVEQSRSSKRLLCLGQSFSVFWL